jgi:hypothetical protein
MVAGLQGSVGTGTKEDESSTGRIWTAGFHHVMACSRLACIFKLMNCLFLQFFKFFWGRSQQQLTESADTVVHLYFIHQID